MVKSAPIAFRLPPALKKALEAAAEAEHRSLSNYVEKLLFEHLKATGYLKEKRP